MGQSIYDFMMSPNSPVNTQAMMDEPQQDNGLVQQILAARMQQPSLQDASHAALNSFVTGSPTTAMDYQGQRMGNIMQQLQTIASLQKVEKPNLPQGYQINRTTGQAELIPGVDPSFGKRADPFSMPMPVILPNGKPGFASKGDVTQPGYQPITGNPDLKAKPTSPVNKALAGRIAQDVQSVNQDASNLATIDDSINQMDTLLSGGLSTGRGPEAAASLDVFNIGQNTRNLQKFNQLANTIALPKTQSLKGATSDKDVKFVKDAFASAGQSPEANRFAIDAGRRFVERQRGIITAYNTMVSDPVYQEHPEFFYKDVQEMINSMPSLEEELNGKQSGGTQPVNLQRPNQQPAGVDELPDPAAHKGQSVTDTVTGKKLVSNGQAWVTQ